MKKRNKEIEHLISYECNDITLGTKVTSKKTGLPCVGVVTAIVSGPLFVDIHDATIIYDKQLFSNFEVVSKGKKKIKLFDRWTVVYPQWMLQPVVYVKFEDMQKHMSLLEFKESIISTEFDDLNFTEQDIIDLYNENVQESETIAYPINDLEII